MRARRWTSLRSPRILESVASARLITLLNSGDTLNNETLPAAYAERSQRIADAIALRQPDRVPAMFFAHYWATRHCGITNRDAMYDHQRAADAIRQVIPDLAPDAYTSFFLNSGRQMELLDFRQVQWPGHNGLGEDSPFQYLDAEYMRGNEYDDYLTDPSGYFLKTYLPRIAGVYEPFRKLPDFPAQFYFSAVHMARVFADPELIKAFETLAAAGRESMKAFQVQMALTQELAQLGFPLAQGGFSGAPFDVVSDYFRGSKGALLDMMRNKDRLLAMVERVLKIIPRSTIEMIGHSPCKTVFIPLHWGLDGFMSPKQFETYYWPSLRQLTITFIEAGLTPCLFWEGDCTSRLEIIKDIPRGKCIYLFERTDLVRAKKVLGDTVCIRGGVPASLLISGTPAQVSDHCKRLIDEVGRDGGFIIDASVGIPDEARYENVRAMFDTTRDYGVYK